MIRACTASLSLLALLIAGCGGGVARDQGHIAFGIRTSSNGATLSPGVDLVVELKVESKTDSSHGVDFRITGVPDTVTATFAPQHLTATQSVSNLTIRTSTSTPEQVYMLHIFAREEGMSQELDIPYRLNVSNDPTDR
jgi:hypothetical protein